MHKVGPIKSRTDVTFFPLLQYFQTVLFIKAQSEGKSDTNFSLHNSLLYSMGFGAVLSEFIYEYIGYIITIITPS